MGSSLLPVFFLLWGLSSLATPNATAAGTPSASVSSSPSVSSSRLANQGTYHWVYVESDQVSSSGRVSGSIIFVASLATYELNPAFIGKPTAASVCNVELTSLAVPNGAKCSPIDAGNDIGVRFTYSNITLAQYNAGWTCQNGSVLYHQGGRYSFCGTVKVLLPSVGHFDATSRWSVSMTFPGTVLSANGSVSGLTATWSLNPSACGTTGCALRAVAQDGRRSNFPYWPILITAVVLIFWAVRRRHQGARVRDARQTPDDLLAPPDM